jgi:hypothetical protein
MRNRIIALATTAAVAAGTTAAVAAPASADGPEREVRGSIGSGHYEINAEKERSSGHSRFEVDADLDGVAKGSTWRMVVRHEGKRISKQVVRATPDDGRYEVDFREVRARNTTGKDTFKVTLVRVGTQTKVTRTLAFRR